MTRSSIALIFIAVVVMGIIVFLFVRLFTVSPDIADREIVLVQKLIHTGVCDTVTSTTLLPGKDTVGTLHYVCMLHTRKNILGKYDSLKLESKKVATEVMNDLLLRDTSEYRLLLILYRQIQTDSVYIYPYRVRDFYKH